MENRQIRPVPLGGGGLRDKIKILLAHSYEEIISLQNLFSAWQEFATGKTKKADVQIFARDLADNIIALHDDLATSSYRHGPYQGFYVNDPKRRHIHKASVRDRLLHHAIHRKLYPFFNKTFIADSFSCRLGKGTHKAVNRFRAFASIVSKNHTRTCWVLKCDIRKFFASIDHQVLLEILREYIVDEKIIQLLREVIESFETRPGDGLPLGNLTSQLFANIYMNEFDQFVKHKLKAKYYIRYADDFVFFSRDKAALSGLIAPIQDFLETKLKLTLHPDKVFIRTLASGVDFLGWVNFCDHRVLRTNTKRRMFKRLSTDHSPQSIQSYLGLLKHGNTHAIRMKLL